jgi:enamine deaminase RidA (YjgF/YER057c/UK114 family)
MRDDAAMGAIDTRLKELGIKLPPPMAAPAGTQLALEFVRVSRGYAYLSGHGPQDGPDSVITGKVGGELTLEQGYAAARQTGLVMIATLKHHLGDLDRVAGWVKALGFVNGAPGFDNTPGVINGFSDLIIDVWGDPGRHARSAIGVAELPFGMAVEVEAIVELNA